MQRRQFIKTTTLGALAPSLGFRPSHSQKTHILTLSFDDGFKKSFLKLTDIHEDHGLKACLNVIASGHFPDFKQVDDWILPELMGNFEDWNSLVGRGHEVMPHSWEHRNLARQEDAVARQLVSKCITYFNDHLDEFDPEKAVFNFPFNASNERLDQYTLTQVRAVRNWGDGAINPFPSKASKRILGCRSNGPDNSDEWVDDMINKFLAMEGGWLILNLHGLDTEGWGPISTNYCIKLLDRLVDIKHLEIIPTGEALEKYG